MALTIGTQLGSHKITGLLGKGGMGEVYRARDSKLKREVALKVLPEEFARDEERLARFQREAELLAVLNHPNIATIHDIEESGGMRYLVMELVDGETLADRIARGPIPAPEALSLATQIAEALEAAHERGIIHRDLKPANVKVTADGKVKVLDFGLAKAFENTSHNDLSNSPTLRMAATNAGVIMGTAGYMSPEQASGRPADKRSDIWSFGVVVFEMLTARRLFDGGETVSHTLADVLRAPIDFGQLPDSVPPRIVELLDRCLDRDLKTRLRDIGEARIAISNYLANPADTAGRSRVPNERIAWAAAGVCTLIAGIIAIVHFGGTGAAPQTLRLQLSVPRGASELSFAVSPDGRYLAISAFLNGKAGLWLRPLDASQAQAIPGTEGAAYPFWSPDSRYLGFFAEGKLKKVLAAGGPPQIICDASQGRGASWNRENSILFSTDDGGGFAIRRVSASGGMPTLEYRAPKGLSRYPTFLPDGHHFLYVVTRASPEENGIYFRSADGKENRRLLPDESSVVFDSGRLLFVRGNTLIAQPFDPVGGKTDGDPVQLAPGVSTTLNVIYAPVTASDNGILIYQTGGAPSGNNELVWFDRAGRRGETLGNASFVFQPAISPDGKSVAFSRLSSLGADVWIWDITRSTERRLTTDPAFELDPFWSPAADRIVFASNRVGGIFNLDEQAVTGTGRQESLLAGATRKAPSQWTRDGKLIFYTATDPKTREDIWALPIENGKPGTPTVFLHSEFEERHAQLSPVGNWLAYTSNESGKDEVYVRAFPSAEESKRISTAGGQEPRWRSDGGELYFLSPDGKMMAVPIKIGTGPKPSIEAGSPKVLFPTPPLAYYIQTGFAYDVTPDGKRFLLTAVVDGTGSSTNLNLVANWNQNAP